MVEEASSGQWWLSSWTKHWQEILTQFPSLSWTVRMCHCTEKQEWGASSGLCIFNFRLYCFFKPIRDCIDLLPSLYCNLTVPYFWIVELFLIFSNYKSTFRERICAYFISVKNHSIINHEAVKLFKDVRRKPQWPWIWQWLLDTIPNAGAMEGRF